MGSSVSAQTKRVDLSGKGLKDFSEIKNIDRASQIEALERIDLTKNKFEDVKPEDVSRLNPLCIQLVTEVILKRNRLKDFPRGLFAFVSLKHLDLGFNEITSVPNEILDFYRLEQLELNDNQISRIPWRMDKLRKCKILFLQNNLLRYYPSYLIKMPALEVLEMSNNPYDNVVYGQPRTADDLLDAIARQKPPGIYAEEAAKEKPPRNAARDLLKNVLRYKEGILAMESFCKKEFNAENLHFYFRVKKFRQDFKSRHAIAHPDLIAEAKAINEQFVRVKSPEQINFSFDVMSKLRAKFEENKEKEINQWIFDEVFEIVAQYLVDEILTRFKYLPENAKLIALVVKQMEKRKKERCALRGKPYTKPASAKPQKMTDRSKSLDMKSPREMDSASQSSDKVQLPKEKKTRSSDTRSTDPSISSELKTSKDRGKNAKSSGTGRKENRSSERKSLND